VVVPNEGKARKQVVDTVRSTVTSYSNTGHQPIRYQYTSTVPRCSIAYLKGLYFERLRETSRYFPKEPKYVQEVDIN